MLKNKIRKLMKERDNLKEKVDNMKIVKNEEIKKLDEKYKNLIDEKTKIINNLTSKVNSNFVGSNISNNILSNGEKLIAVNFISVDQRINHNIICTNKTKFYEIEVELYDKYPEYKENDNYFMFNGFKINRWKTLEENRINGYTIILNKIADE